MIQSFRPCKNPIYLVRGVSGSGKSTFAKRLLEALAKVLGCTDSALYETDDFWVKGDSYDFDRDLLAIAHNWTLGRVCKHCRDFKDSPVIVANTFCEWEEIHPYFNLARKFGRWLVILEMTNAPGDVWKETGKVIANTHNVPEEAVRSQMWRFNHGLDSIKVNQDNWKAVIEELMKQHRKALRK